jgi:hypothetical protein
MRTPTSTLAGADPIEEKKLHKRRRRLAKGAEELHPGAGWQVYQMWRERNERLFGRQMQHCGLQFGPICRVGRRGEAAQPKGKATLKRPFFYGRWLLREQVLVLDRRLLRPDGRVWWLGHEQLGPRFVGDVLLRQMMCQYIDTAGQGENPAAEALGPGSAPTRPFCNGPLWDSPLWIGEVNRLRGALDVEDGTAALLPGKAVAEGRVPNGILTARETALWPYLSRPEGYYKEDPETVFTEELPPSD